MEKIISEGKTFEEALGKTGLDAEMVVYKNVEDKSKLFKSKSVKLEIYKKDDVLSEIQRFLTKVITNLNLEVSFEVSKKDSRPILRIYSSDNSRIIGKSGNTIRALETIAKQYIFQLIGVNFHFSVDVANYKAKQENRIVGLAKKLANDAIETNVEIEMDNMNSYERRIVHNALNEIEGITTESRGEDPNRYIVIIPK